MIFLGSYPIKYVVDIGTLFIIAEFDLGMNSDDDTYDDLNLIGMGNKNATILHMLALKFNKIWL